MFVDIWSSRLCNICVQLKVENVDPTCDVAESSKTGVRLMSSTLRKCNGCRLVVYCDPNHQKMDWPQHRNLCRATQKVMTVYEVNHPYLLGGQPTDAESMESAIIQLKFVLRSFLKRPLLFHEEELTSFPQYCSVCFKLRQLRSCSRCQAVSYCSEEHALLDQVNHDRRCGLLQLYYTPYKLQPSTVVHLTFHHRVPNLYKTDLFGAFHHATLKTLPPVPTSSLAAYNLFAIAGDFSCIGTICYALSFTQMDDYKSAKFVIFVIGAVFEQQMWFQDVHTRFFFLQFPQISLLRLFFIGPEVEGQDKEVVYSFQGKGRCVHYVKFRGLFQDFIHSHNIKPHLIISFNCGFSESMNESDQLKEGGDTANVPPVAKGDSKSNDTQTPGSSKTEGNQSGDCSSGGIQSTSSRARKTWPWPPGIVEILYTFSVPIVFTSLTSQDALFDYATIIRVASIENPSVRVSRFLRTEDNLNPFRDLRPLRHWRISGRDEIVYRNGYVQGLYSKFES